MRPISLYVVAAANSNVWLAQISWRMLTPSSDQFRSSAPELIMTDKLPIQVTYWAARQYGRVELRELDGMEEFRHELAEGYIALVRGRPAGLGGLYQLSAEILSTFDLSHLVRLLLDGVAFDLIKEGTKAFVLRPFLSAYKHFRDKNGAHDGRLETLRLVFQDSVVTIDNLGHDDILSSIRDILLTLAANYDRLLLDTGEPPFEIHVPAFADPAEDRLSPYRAMLEVDETIRGISADDYFRYWGLWYDFAGHSAVFDVRARHRLPERFLNRYRYDFEWQERRRRQNAHRPPASRPEDV